MPLFKAAPVRRLIVAATTIAAFAAPAAALAQAPGSLAELGCLQLSSSSTECPTNDQGGAGLSGASDVAVSPDGRNVYVTGSNDEAVAEFARGADGTLTQLAPQNQCIADPSNDGTSSCQADNGGASGLVDPQAIVVSPDGHNVYVAAQDFNGNGTIAELTRNADGSLAPLSGHDCIAENNPNPGGCDDNNGFGIAQPFALAISPDGSNVYVVDEQNEDIAVFNRAADGSLSQPGAADDCIADVNFASSECGSTAAARSR